MAEVLSQAEIDSLLHALSSGSISVENIKEEEEQKRIRIYDFKRPNRFSKEQIRTLYMLHDNFARLLSTYLAAHLRTPVQINLLSVQEMTFDEFSRSLPSPTLMAMVSLTELSGQMLVEVNLSLALAFVERLFGGKASGIASVRTLTDIELAVLGRIMAQILQLLDEAWVNISALGAMLERLETNPQFLQIVAPTEMVALVSLQVKVDEAEGLFNLCFPYLLLKPIAAKLSAHHWFSTQEQSELGVNQELMRQRLAGAMVPVSALLGTADIVVEDLLNLQEGDVIKLDTPAAGGIKVLVGEKPKFWGRPGQVGNKVGVKITGRYKGDESSG
ncbi:MAG: flagellar motor switch protein FliM [Firmicutes bacterium]|nr:flagellar motor switch protein FliM [Bacillota bacterium]